MKTKGEEKWFVEYERDYKWYAVKKGGFRESTHYFRTEALQRAKDLNDIDEVIELNDNDII